MSCAFLVSNDVILSVADLPKVFAAVLMDIAEGAARADASSLSAVPFTSVDREREALSTGLLTAVATGLTTLAGSGLGRTGWGSGTGSGTLPSRKLVMVRSTFWVCTGRADNVSVTSDLRNKQDTKIRLAAMFGETLNLSKPRND